LFSYHLSTNKIGKHNAETYGSSWKPTMLDGFDRSNWVRMIGIGQQPVWIVGVAAAGATKRSYLWRCSRIGGRCYVMELGSCLSEFQLNTEKGWYSNVSGGVAWSVHEYEELTAISCNVAWINRLLKQVAKITYGTKMLLVCDTRDELVSQKTFTQDPFQASNFPSALPLPLGALLPWWLYFCFQYQLALMGVSHSALNALSSIGEFQRWLGEHHCKSRSTGLLVLGGIAMGLRFWSVVFFGLWTF